MAPVTSDSEVPLRICLLGYRGNPHSGGQGIYLRHVSRALRDLGHSVDVVCGEPYPVLDDGVELVRLPGLNLYASDDPLRALRTRHLRSLTDTFEWLSVLSGGFPEPLTFGRRALAYLRQHRNRYDVVHDNQSLAYGLLGLERLGLPVLATIHHPITHDRDAALAAAAGRGQRLAVRRWYAFLAMQGRVARRLRQVVTVSQSARADIVRAFGVPPNAIEVIANGVQTEIFHPMADQPRVRATPEGGAWRLITTASADAPMKGLRFLLQALASLRERHRAITLTVVGQVRPRGPTAALIETLGLGAAVEVRSGVSAETIAQLYAGADVAVVPSLYEGFGLPAAEAMACGVPVVSTRGGALPEVVGDAGVLVPAGDSEALAAGIERVLNDRALAASLAAAGPERVRAEFTWARTGQALAGLYRETMARQGHGTRARGEADGDRGLQPT